MFEDEIHDLFKLRGEDFYTSIEGKGGKSETPGLQRTRCTPKPYRRFACNFLAISTLQEASVSAQ